MPLLSKTRHPGAYKRLAEELLAPPHCRERMAIPCLDVVRFADTVGYHSDKTRNVWPYRVTSSTHSTPTNASTSSPSNRLTEICFRKAGRNKNRLPVQPSSAEHRRGARPGQRR